MRYLAILLFLLISNTAFSDSIQKWTDASGQIHYGDNSPPQDSKNNQRIEVHSNFDESSYEEAIKRNTALYKEVEKIERKEKSRAKVAEKRLDDYFKFLDKKDKETERSRAKKRRSHDLERNRSSIKIKRSKPGKVSADKNKSIRLN